jgi:hypothetical protein
VNPIQSYITKQRQACARRFPVLYDIYSTEKTNGIESFLTSSLVGLLDVIEQEIDALYESADGTVHMDKLARMFEEVREAA